MDEDIRTYEIVRSVGRAPEVIRLDIPADYKVTYGPIQPNGRQSGEGYVLRIYENEKMQRAVFHNVLSFRDLSLSMKVQVEQEATEENVVLDTNGNAEVQARRQVQKTWEARP